MQPVLPPMKLTLAETYGKKMAKEDKQNETKERCWGEDLTKRNLRDLASKDVFKRDEAQRLHEEKTQIDHDNWMLMMREERLGQSKRRKT